MNWLDRAIFDLIIGVVLGILIFWWR